MGLIKAGLGSLGGVLADQWKEYFVCDAMPKDVLARKGQKKTSGRSSNTKGSDNVITNGSGLVVAEGQCAIIVDQGKVAEYCAVPGEYTYDSQTEPSIFAGSFGDSIKRTFKEIGKRFTYGGEPPKDQRVYYFNTKELMENPFGTANPVPFRVVDSRIGIDLDVSIRCNGYYSYRIENAILFYTNVCGNFAGGDYMRSEIDKQLKTEFINSLRPLFGKVSHMEIRPYEIPDHEEEILDAANQVLDEKWGQLRGLKLVSVAFQNVDLPEEDQKMLKEVQRNAAFRDPNMAAAHLVGAQAQAMQDAANNQNGAMNAFMGMGMAQGVGAGQAANLFQIGQQQAAQQPAAPAPAPAPAQGGWTCPSCGKQATGKFCPECGTKKPEDDTWTCSCGAVNKGKFCPNCGQKRPEAAAAYKCSNCGWEPEDPHHPPKFCPECGDIFDDNDKV